MVVTKSTAMKGAAAGGAATAGSLLFGPTLGAPAAGIAADYATDSNSRTYTKAGIAVGVTSLFVGGMSTAGGGGGSGVM